MKVNVVGRHVKVTDAMQRYAEEKAGKVGGVEIRLCRDDADPPGGDLEGEIAETAVRHALEPDHRNTRMLIRPSMAMTMKRLCMTAFVVTCGISVIEPRTSSP